MQARNKPVILFIAEAVTLAHFARIITLAKTLDPSVYEVVIASDPRYARLEGLLDGAFRPIHSISSEEFAQALTRGKPLYSVETLSQYVEDDLALLDSLKPNLVVGDFRLSLAVSAPLHKVPYAAVANAYWSPFAEIMYPVPSLPVTRILGVSLAQALFNTVRPIVFALHAHPLNVVRHRYGLSTLGSDLRNIYTWGNYTLYADIPELIPMSSLPSRHTYLGPVLWSTSMPLPDWWSHLPRDKPVVFLTLGSSGHANLLPMVLAALSRLPITVIAATAGAVALTDVPANAYVSNYLPMKLATERSILVICNGGSLTTYQALANWVPVIGLCSNMDQLLNMGAVESLGAGVLLRAADVSSAGVMEAVTTILNNSSYAQKAGQLGQILQQYDIGKRFREIVAEIISKGEELT
ncbi:MAG: glycosyltransferase [Nitrosospira multiformis]|nr:glycosyltransferase [Nitrosospira multiformis]